MIDGPAFLPDSEWRPARSAGTEDLINAGA
jgi:hypothetical protein